MFRVIEKELKEHMRTVEIFIKSPYYFREFWPHTYYLLPSTFQVMFDAKNF